MRGRDTLSLGSVTSTHHRLGARGCRRVRGAEGAQLGGLQLRLYSHTANPSPPLSIADGATVASARISWSGSHGPISLVTPLTVAVLPGPSKIAGPMSGGTVCAPTGRAESPTCGASTIHSAEDLLIGKQPLVALALALQVTDLVNVQPLVVSAG